MAYTYDAWGKPLTVTGSMAGTLGKVNPLRYRGYVYDEETGLYYLGSRYYDPGVGRWISVEPSVFSAGFDGGAGLIGFNVYVYCANNPVGLFDPTGEFAITTFLICIGVGTIIGGVTGGVVSYNAGKESGLEGSDLAWKTVSGVGKGAIIGGTGGSLFGIVGAVGSIYGATSIAGTATFTGSMNIFARTAEVMVL